VYYFLAASALFPWCWPLKGRLERTGIARYNSGQRSQHNLLANLVQKLKDKSDIEIAKTLQAEAQSTPGLKAEMDALLEKLDALQQAEQHLSTDDVPGCQYHPSKNSPS